MIGVIANQDSHAAVREFFQLFKTPWEFYRVDRHYDVVVCTNETEVRECSAQLTVIYSSHELPWDIDTNARVTSRGQGSLFVLSEGMRIPIYNNWATLTSKYTCILFNEGSGQQCGYLHERENGNFVARIGYDLFDEVAALLSEGQPFANASIPTLDFHISLLRNLILGCRLPLVEIPPVPEGYCFIACLTHDLDHPSIRQHKFDRTMFGFLYRALIGSLLAGLRRRMCLRNVAANWSAALKLPFVYLGVAEDFWKQFDAYTTLDGGPHSSFFVIPFKRSPGSKDGNVAPALRGAGYGAADITVELRKLRGEGHEIGLHGIDAWHDLPKGREELAEIVRVTQVQVAGVRMHWLYFDKHSPEVLEKLGFEYDSTVGYNEAIGYRAGTTQVYKPPQTTRLLELPLHVMDTALFSSGRQNLSPVQAAKVVNDILDHAANFGGVVTINWHDRSILPERLWRNFYIDLVSELEKRGAWFATAGDAVRWFRKRRLATFEDKGLKPHQGMADTSGDTNLPGLSLRIHPASTGRASIYANAQ